MDLQYVVPNMTHQGGIQSYARTVAEYLPTENFSLKWIDFSDPARDLKVLARLSKARLTPVALKGRTASGITHHWFPTSAILDFARSTVVTCHGSELLHDGAYGLRNRAIKAALGRAAAVTVPSNFTKELLVDRFATDPASIHVIPPGVDIGRARPRLNLTKDELPVKVGCLSRLVERKNIAESVRAAGLLAKSQPRPVEFHLAGDGPELSAILEAGKRARVKVVNWGQVPDEVKWADFLPSLDVFVMATRPLSMDVEGFGIVYIEANASGVPVVASSNGGVVDAVSPGRSGFFAAPDAVSMAGAMQACLARGASLRESSLLWAAQFSGKVCGQAYISLYEGLR